MAKKSGSVMLRFYGYLFMVYLLTILICWPTIYYFTQQQVQRASEKELTLLVDMVKSLRSFIGKDLRPYFLPKGILFPPAVSSTVATKHVSKFFNERQPDYYIRITADNPLNEENQPEDLELALLKRFRDNRELKGLVEKGMIRGRTYLVSAKPEIVKSKNCLICHGDVDNAPDVIQREYGVTSGYGWKMDTVAGVSVVGVPFADVGAIAFRRSWAATGVLTGLFAIVFLAVTLLVRQLILLPLIRITKAAQGLSNGQLEEMISLDRQDEIGELARSFELVRRSLLIAMKRMQRKK